VETDASFTAFSSVLLQSYRKRMMPVAFHAGKVNVSKQRFIVEDSGLLAIIKS
jgi:RNase H-like domain found in reverse transcriptase